MSAGSVLIIDDDRGFRFAMKKALSRVGFDVHEVQSAEEALTELRGLKPPDAALLDLRMGGMGGLELLRRRGGVPTRFIVLTGHGSVQAAVEAMRLGAFSFLEKPVDADVLKPLLEQAVAEAKVTTHGPQAGFAPPMVGGSAVMSTLREFVRRVGPSDETVAISGETGSGKEIVARHLHLTSARREKPFVAFNGACVPRELFESELFGHRRGAFTGATEDHPGLFREAAGGTLFIDELAELPIDSQAKLLRSLETRTIRPVGEKREVPIDVRIVAATNRDLWVEVQAGRFREDLYFRLQVLPVTIAPLRARLEDMEELVNHLLERLGGRHRVNQAAIEVMRSHDWPGNVRELLNVLRRASLFADTPELDGALVHRMIAASAFAHSAPPATYPSSPPPAPSSSSPASGTTSLADVERDHIERVLAEMGGNVTRSASALGIDRRTLQRKLKAYGMGGGD